jgi:hypothetical protein
MKPAEYISLLRKFYKGLRRRLDRNFLIFLFFVFIAAIFWLLNELNQDSIADVSYPVKYTNLPGNKILVNDMPSKLGIKIQGPGYTLLKYKMSPRFIPLNLDMRSYFLRQKPGTGNDEKYLLTKDLISRFERRLDGVTRIIQILPDTLFFRFDSIVRKAVPVVPRVDYTTARQYMLSDDPQVDPDSIVVSGPGMIVDTIQQVNTVLKKYQSLNKTVQEEVEIAEIPKLTYNVEQVTLILPIEQFTEAQLDIPIEAVNVPDSMMLKPFPNHVTLTCLAGLSEYEKLSEHLFRAEVDYAAIDQTLGGKLKVEITSAPDFVRSIKIFPIYVEFVIERK